ncbi:hypothetical protein BS78_06G207100 [Paspalum vaginatum]|nr:hypothetical protein BS78_06G207100 [Paspalum vaginatum]
MPPKKRAAASSKKPPPPSQPSQPAKFGILHFFERQTQASQSAKRQKPEPPPPPPPPPPTPQEEEPSEVSPEVTKTLAPKRVRFSPGMLIKQSQDDGAAEVVTWKISPVNRRLGTVKSRQFMGMKLQPCSNNETNSSLEAMKKWHSSPLGLSRCTASGNNSGAMGSALVGCDGVEDTQSPFRTPPSLSYGYSELNSCVTSEGDPEPLGAGQHKKALLDLLDQVEDAIAEEESPVDPGNKGRQSTKEDGTSINCSPVADGDLTIPPRKTIDTPSFNSFLVLEVSEKHKTDDSSCDVKVLRLLNEYSGKECAVHLYDEWFHSTVGPGDTVNVIGEFSDQEKCIVDHNNNLIIIHPELLISGTRVASSFHCPRRSVLDDRLKSNEYSTSALTGTLLHQVFQAGLLEDAPSWQFLEQQAKEVLLRNIESLYACGANENNMYSTLVEAIPKILNWFKCFLKGSKCSNVDFGLNEGRKTVGVTEVMDIEEMAWAPRYGLKGIIDASVRSRVESCNDGSYDRIMPLEFKTGKGTSGQTAMEHSAQVILYTLLMTERYLNKDIDLGLLYYLHTDQTLGIKVKRSDLIGLIMRRNELAADILKASISQSLPPMLQSPPTCNGCRHLISCTIYHKAHGGNATTSGLGNLFENHVNHLTVTHHNFLKHWDRLIDLEARASQVKRKNIFQPHHSNSSSGTSAPFYFVLDIKNGHSIDSSGKSKRYIYNFVHQKMQPETTDQLDAQFNSLDFSLKCGDPVVLSTQSGRIAVANGSIRDISCSHITVSVPRRLRIPYSNSLSEQDLTSEIWRIDKDEFSSSFAIMRLNLIQLFAQNPQNSHLRKLIVDLEAPRFDSGGLLSQDPALSYIQSLPNLNNDQQRSLHKILGAKDYALILGMPGTGKTYTMVHAVKSLLIRGESILLTSYTNSAIDTLLMKLKTEGVDFIRIGRHEAVHPDVRGHCLSTTEVQSVDAIKARMEQVQVVGVTCLGMYHPLLAHKKFDTCIMDEAGQITLPVSLGPLMLATKFVLVGDHYQLPPLVQSSEARENGMGISLFWRLSEAHPQAISALRCQYRMSSGIMELSNSLIYGNRLCCGSLEIANAKLKFSGREPVHLKLKEILNPDRAVIFANTDQIPAHEAKDHRTVNNPTEAHIISWIIKELIRRGVAQHDIGIITPYNAQVNLIQQCADGLVEVHTIDKYQGRDKECIIVSFVRSTANSRASGSSLLGDWHRINVLLTRAKKKLIMVGSRGTLSTIPLLRLLVDKVAEVGGLLELTNKDVHSFR